MQVESSWFLILNEEMNMAILTDEYLREKEESEESLEEVVPPADIVAFNESRSCADLFRLHKKNQLDIAPDFQRKIVWNNRDQTLFVDSLMKQLPIPSLCISLDAKTQNRVVIDGLQRMATIIKFLDYENKDWKLSSCEDVDGRISGKYVSQIVENYPDLYASVENLTLPITVLRCDYSKRTHMDYLFNIFRRLNSGGRKLLNQEIRNCVYHGTFNEYLHEVVRSREWLSAMHVNINKIESARYGYEERALRFFAMNDGWEKYSGNLALFLNQYMSKHKESTPSNLVAKDCLLKRVLRVIMRISIPLEVIRNKNLMEGIMVGISKNIDKGESLSDQELTDRYEELKKTNAYSVDIKEGMAHTDKVQERIRQAIYVFGDKS